MMITLILLTVVVLSGCVSDMQPPKDPVVLEHIEMFEEGRRAASHGDTLKADDKYRQLISKGNRYGEYGFAMQTLRREPDSLEAVKYLLACAKRSDYTSELFPDSAMDSAFSAAAMSKLAEIAISEHDRDDVAASLRAKMYDIITPQVRAWAAEQKADSELASIYFDIITAVEYARPVSEYVKEFKWTELGEIFMPEPNPTDKAGSGGRENSPPAKPDYTVVKFVKAQDADCRYDFEVHLSSDNSIELMDKVKSAIRRMLVKEFLSAHPTFSVNDIGISYPFWDHSGATIKGIVIANTMRMEVVRREYIKETGKGTVVVRFGDSDVAAATKLALENIEAIASRHNILNVVGSSPPKDARYEVVKSRKTDDGLFEIEFKCE